VQRKEALAVEIFSSQFLAALAAIVVIDLVLAGDNAIVIALAARNLPDRLRKRAIIWGTIGAIAVRAAMTAIVVWLLQVPGLMFFGGLMLLWIAYRLLVPAGGGKDHGIEAANGFWPAMGTIVIADAMMGLDNVLAVAGAAHGSFLLVVLGLVISIPIVVCGSQLVLKLIDRFPQITYLGAGVLVLTAAMMITGEPHIKASVADQKALVWMVHAALVTAVLSLAIIRNRARRQQMAS
jgi:YjbE family integral membrane protein